VTLYDVAVGYQRFGGPCRVHLHRIATRPLNLKNIQFNLHRCGKLKSSMKSVNMDTEIVLIFFGPACVYSYVTNRYHYDQFL